MVAIAESLALRNTSESHEIVSSHDSDRPWGPGSLGEGCSGIALFFAYLSRAATAVGSSPERAAEHRLLAERFADQGADRLAEGLSDPSLYCGFTGTAWMIRHLGTLWGDPEAASYTEEVDALLVALLGTEDWTAELDLITGLAGLGTYGLQAIASGGPVEDLVASVVRHLDRKAEVSAHGFTWFTPPRLLDRASRDNFPEGYYNVGVAHGVPGILAILARAARAGIAAERAAALAEGAFDWLMGQRLGPESPSVFPSFVPPGGSPWPSRLAWCYGDAGVAAALWGAAESLDEPRMRRAAIDVGRRAASRDPASAWVQDGCLCHGAAGLALIFDRLFKATGEEVFRDAAVAWYRRLLGQRSESGVLGGFGSWTSLSGEEGGFRREERPGLLTGAAGIGLALLAAISSDAPDWDQALLISPERTRSSDRGRTGPVEKAVL